MIPSRSSSATTLRPSGVSAAGPLDPHPVGEIVAAVPGELRRAQPEPVEVAEQRRRPRAPRTEDRLQPLEVEDQGKRAGRDRGIDVTGGLDGTQTVAASRLDEDVIDRLERAQVRASLRVVHFRYVAPHGEQLHGHAAGA